MASGRDSVIPLIPERIVPSQYASTSSADSSGVLLKQAWAASTSRSSALLPQCSPNGVQPIPTTATRSRMPLLAIGRLLAGQRPGLPEVVVHAPGGEQPAERQL